MGLDCFQSSTSLGGELFASRMIGSLPVLGHRAGMWGRFEDEGRGWTAASGTQMMLIYIHDPIVYRLLR